MMTSRGIFLLALLLLVPGTAFAQVAVSYENGNLSVHCTDASIEQVLERVKEATGMELILEDAVKNRRVSANIEDQPLSLALERLLEGTGVNYVMLYDRADWAKVAKMFVGAGGGAVAAGSPGLGRSFSSPALEPPEPDPVYGEEPPLEEEVYDPAASGEEAYEETPFGEEPMPGMETGMEGEMPPDEAFPQSEPPLDESAAPDYVPEPPSFPRSPFTPGLESSPFGRRQQPQPPAGMPNAAPGTEEQPPPAVFPFLDPYGRPIPVPPGLANPPQQQNPQDPQKQNPQ